MLKKTLLRKKGRTRVTFIPPCELTDPTNFLVGDFSAWLSSCPMQRQNDESCPAVIDWPPGREYPFQDWMDGTEWVDDPQAASYVLDPYGG